MANAASEFEKEVDRLADLLRSGFISEEEHDTRLVALEDSYHIERTTKKLTYTQDEYSESSTMDYYSKSIIPMPTITREPDQTDEPPSPDLFAQHQVAKPKRWADVAMPPSAIALRDLTASRLKTNTLWRGWWAEVKELCNPDNVKPVDRRPLVLSFTNVWLGNWMQVKTPGSFVIMQAHSHMCNELRSNSDDVIISPCPYPFGGKAVITEGCSFRLQPETFKPTPAEIANIELYKLPPGTLFVDGESYRKAAGRHTEDENIITGVFNAIDPAGPKIQFGENILTEAIWDKEYTDFEPDASEAGYDRLYEGRLQADGSLSGTWKEEKSGTQGVWSVSIPAEVYKVENIWEDIRNAENRWNLAHPSERELQRNARHPQRGGRKRGNKR